MFLIRCAFTLFAEALGLLPARTLSDAIEKRWLPSPGALPAGVEALWRATFGRERIFAGATAIGLTRSEIALLHRVASCRWADVEPVILGTLLERAHGPGERRALGAHYTPRAYVERIVRPTVEDALRADWGAVEVEVRRLVGASEIPAARQALRAFHARLCATRILDPACGTGNFLCVALGVLQRIEREVLARLASLGDVRSSPRPDAPRVSPVQLLGIEVKRSAKEVAEAVLWIAYLQGRSGARGEALPPSAGEARPVGAIECRDAVLAWDAIEVAGTGRARSKVERYVNPRQAEWPRADFIVGNPPFMGKLRLRSTLGEGYASALRQAYDGEVPRGADYVMCWWSRAARAVGTGHARRFGLVTPSSITQRMNRPVVARALSVDPRIELVLALPDCPWVDGGAQVRIAMTVGAAASRGATVRATRRGDGAGGVEVGPTATVNADLSRRIDVSSVTRLVANRRMSHVGVGLHGRGFALEAEAAAHLVSEAIASGVRAPRRFIRPTETGRDLAHSPRHRFVDRSLGPLRAGGQGARSHPPVARHAREARARQQPARGAPPRLLAVRRERPPDARGRPRPAPLHRHDALGTSPGLPLHRRGRPARSDHRRRRVRRPLGARRALGAPPPRLGRGDRRTPRGRQRPQVPEGDLLRCLPLLRSRAARRERIAEIGSRLDAHRRSRQAAHPGLSITGMYNVMGKLRAGEGLTDRERLILDRGLVPTLSQLHDELDAAVIEAYGWPREVTDDQILERLVALNAERAEEEGRGIVRWLRPELQRSQAGALDASA